MAAPNAGARYVETTRSLVTHREVNTSADATTTQTIHTTTTGKRVIIKAIYFSTAVAGNFTLQVGAANICNLKPFGANGGLERNECYIERAGATLFSSGANVTWTFSAAGRVHLELELEEVDA